MESPVEPGRVSTPRAVKKPVTEVALLHRSVINTTVWTVVFIAFHVYWFLGGKFGFGDQEKTIPDVDSPAVAVYSIIVGLMFLAGLALPAAIVLPWTRWIPRWMLHAAAWFGAAILLLRGVAGLLDTALRVTGLADNGITGMTWEQVTGDPDPSAYTIWSGSGIDAYFLLGGVLFLLLAVRATRVHRATREV